MTVKLIAFPDQFGLSKNVSSTIIVTNNTSDVSGHLVNVLKVLASTCNFTYELHFQNSSTFGDITEKDNNYIITGAYKTLLNSSN